jgi:hypothetical protein
MLLRSRSRTREDQPGTATRPAARTADPGFGGILRTLVRRAEGLSPGKLHVVGGEGLRFCESTSAGAAATAPQWGSRPRRERQGRSRRVHGRCGTRPFRAVVRRRTRDEQETPAPRRSETTWVSNRAVRTGARQRHRRAHPRRRPADGSKSASGTFTLRCLGRGFGGWAGQGSLGGTERDELPYGLWPRTASPSNLHHKPVG